ncbi:MAG: M14 family zinc carboxypeptidase [Candidatus Nanopelagicales bacterium]
MERREFLTGAGAAIAAAFGSLAWPGNAHAADGVKHYVIGHSTNDRPIKAYLIGDENAPNRYLVMGQMHGDEPAGRLICHDRLLNKGPVRDVALWVVPTMNPDGSIRGTRTNARGVDLNRNFPSNTWVRRGNGTRYYSGPHPSSEPETRAIVKFFADIQPRTIVSIHQPLACVDYSGGSHAVTRWLSEHLHLPVCHIQVTGGGTMTSWYNPKFPKKTAVTIEMPTSTSPAYRGHVADVLIRHAAQRRN